MTHEQMQFAYNYGWNDAMADLDGRSQSGDGFEYGNPYNRSDKRFAEYEAGYQDAMKTPYALSFLNGGIIN